MIVQYRKINQAWAQGIKLIKVVCLLNEFSWTAMEKKWESLILPYSKELPSIPLRTANMKFNPSPRATSLQLKPSKTIKTQSIMKSQTANFQTHKFRSTLIKNPIFTILKHLSIPCGISFCNNPPTTLKLAWSLFLSLLSGL